MKAIVQCEPGLLFVAQLDDTVEGEPIQGYSKRMTKEELLAEDDFLMGKYAINVSDVEIPYTAPVDTEWLEGEFKAGRAKVIARGDLLRKS